MVFLVVGNPQNRRFGFFQKACIRAGYPEPRILPWSSLLKKPELFLPALSGCDALRIESPGEDADVDALLIQRGGGTPAASTEYHKGKISNQKNWYTGWEQTLREIEEATPSHIHMMNAPSEIALFFDKFRCQTFLAENGIPTPQILGTAQNASGVYSLMEHRRASRVFVKPRHSSSASGVVALQMAREKVLATTSAKLENGALYNSLKLSHYDTLFQTTQLLDILGKQEIMVEKWFPKLIVNRSVVDFRILVIAGKARHIVARSSRSPLTNLHLGNARGNIAKIRQELGEHLWREMRSLSERTAALFPDCHYIALDLMVGSRRDCLAIAEVNAFGDLLPELFSNGEDSYLAELTSWDPQMSRSS